MKREVAEVAEPVESFERQDRGLQCMRDAAVHMGSEGKAKPGWHTSAYILIFGLAVTGASVIPEAFSRPSSFLCKIWAG